MNLMVAICRYTWFLGITIWFCMVRRTHVNKNKDKTLVIKEFAILSAP